MAADEVRPWSPEEAEDFLRAAEGDRLFALFAVGGGSRASEGGLVFTSTIGTVVEPRNLSRLLDELIIKAGVRRIRFNDLRHTCASLLLAQGVPPRVVMDVLGHSQFSITMDLYSHVMPTALREAAAAMDRDLGSRTRR